MKTILVLTDFSINATYTAQYALQLAQKIEANILLCNLYSSSRGETAPAKTWPLEQAEKNSIDDLSVMVSQLKSQLDNDYNKGKFRPGIEQCSKEGVLDENINDIAAGRDILMAVISMHRADFLTTMLSGNHAKAIIEKANFPVLVIPYQVRFKPYKTIAFATAMNYSDIGVLQALCGLARYAGSEIVITHVSKELSGQPGMNVVKNFFNQIPSKVTYPHILYNIIKGSHILRGLERLIARADVDLLVLVHRKENFFRKLFNGSITQKLALRASKPLLIFPCAQVQETLPVF